MRRFLIVEDEQPKRERITDFLNAQFPKCLIETANSVRSGISSIQKTTPDLMILDMSLPTFDIASGELGGRPQGFGGIEILNHMAMNDLSCPVIVVTGYEAFVNDEDIGVSLDDMALNLKNEHGNVFIGIVYYNSLYETWENELLNLIENL